MTRVEEASLTAHLRKGSFVITLQRGSLERCTSFRPLVSTVCRVLHLAKFFTKSFRPALFVITLVQALLEQGAFFKPLVSSVSRALDLTKVLFQSIGPALFVA